MVEGAEDSNGGHAVMSHGNYYTSPNIFPGSVLNPLEPLRGLKELSAIISQIMACPHPQTHHDFSLCNTPSPSSAAPQAARLGFWEPAAPSLHDRCPCARYQEHERARRGASRLMPVPGQDRVCLGDSGEPPWECRSKL